MKYLKFIVAIIIISASSTSLVFADFQLENWQFKKNINVQNTSSSYVKVMLDKDVSKHTTWNDLRVVSQSNEEIPYQLIEERASVGNNFYAASLSDLSVRDDNTMFVLDLGVAGTLHNQLEIQTKSVNFKKRVFVYASDSLNSHDSSAWRQLTSDGYIYNFSDSRSGFNAGSGIVSYPKSSSRFLRVVIGAGEGGLVQVSETQVFRYEVSAAEVNISSVSLEVNQNSSEKTTELIADIGMSGVPTYSIILSSDDSNFDRRVVVQTSNDKSSWQRISEGYIFKIETPIFQGSQLTLSYPEVRNRYVRVIVFNYDDKPVTFNDGAQIVGIQRSIVFEASPRNQYALYYGNRSAGAPRYDFQKIFQYLETNAFGVTSLGIEQLNAQYKIPEEQIIPFTERYPFLLNSVLVVLVIVIGVFIYFYMRKVIKKTEVEDGTTTV